MAQAIQLFGAFLILIAYALAQLGMLSARGVPFLLLNLAVRSSSSVAPTTRNSGGSSCRGRLGGGVGRGASAPAFGAGNGLGRRRCRALLSQYR